MTTVLDHRLGFSHRAMRLTIKQGFVPVDVPCNGCTACCQSDLIMLKPEYGDDPDLYDTMPMINPMTGAKGLALKHKPEGGCIYLGETGCTIHGHAPFICRTFDCRRFVKNLSRADRRRYVRLGLLGKDVIEAGRQRMHTLKETT